MYSRGKCLVVEDDLDVRELLSLILTGEGFDVYSVASGTEGLKVAQTTDLVLIALDLGPPGVDGQELGRSFKNASGAPLLVITTKARAINDDEGLAVGADAYLVKPFRPALLRMLANRLSPQKQLQTHTPQNRTFIAANRPASNFSLNNSAGFFVRLYRMR